MPATGEYGGIAMSALITLSDVSFSIDGKNILQSVDLHIDEREIVTIVGPNGAGKSTLLSVALHLRKPTSGHVKHRKKLRLAYVPQSINRDPTMPVSVMDFLQLAKSAPSKLAIQAILQELGLGKLSKTLINHLSGGELRRVLFARALLNKPELLVLDEPTAGVDVMGQEQFYEQLNALRERYQFAILMVSHDLHLVMSSTDRVVCLNQHICCQGQPVHVLHDPHYQALFGQLKQQPEQEPKLAFYEHHHDHEH